MSIDDNNYIAKICNISVIKPEQVRLIVTEALKCLHKTIYCDYESTSSAILKCYYNFGIEACFHFVMILARCDEENGWIYSEILQRFLPSDEILPLTSIYDEWDKEVDNNKPKFYKFPIQDLMEEKEQKICEIEREYNDYTNRVNMIVKAKYDDYVRKAIDDIKALGPESCLSGDGSELTNVWEEFKCQLQGEHSIYFGVYEYALRAICRNKVEVVTENELRLLWLGSDAYLDFDGNGFPVKNEMIDVVEDELYSSLCRVAVNEELEYLKEQDDYE